MKGQLPAQVMDERLQRLQAAINTEQLAFNQLALGKRMQILLERRGKFAGQLLGKSPWLQSVVVDAADARIGDIIDVNIVSAGPNSLNGVMAARQAA